MKPVPRPPFRLKDIAFQAGISLATVDRALHNRGHVHPDTVRRIAAAIQELTDQSRGITSAGPQFTFDVLMVAPDRFSGTVQQALASAFHQFSRNNLRGRFDIHQDLPEPALCRKLRTIAKRGSHGLIVKLPDTPAVAAATNEVLAAGIPVVTLVTDLPARTAYVGMDNAAVGRTAAFFMHRFSHRPPNVLISASSHDFQGEAVRITAFQAELAALSPDSRIVKTSGGFGKNTETEARVSAVLRQNPDLNAVYSAGGGNRAILAAFAASRQTCRTFLAHDMDRDNRALLAAGKIDLVLYHDLNADAVQACQVILKHHRALPQSLGTEPSEIRIATRVSAGY